MARKRGVFIGQPPTIEAYARTHAAMFYYFGRKGRLAELYPYPQYTTIIEPFAGSMAFTLHYQPARAIGIEIDPSVCDVWQRICAKHINQLRD
jgi:site-specific DNA-adenine methylase